MRKFGGYETVQELFRGGLGSVFSARREGESGAAPAFAVKTCEPVVEIVGEAQAKAAVRQFVEAAKVQQAAAGGGGSGGGGGESHWAPVYDVGETSYGAYYVTDHFERGSLERLSVGMVRVDGRAMHRVMSGIAAGLMEMERACGRPHGNLRPSNILVSFAGGLDTARVALSDPLATGLVDEARDRAEDLRAMGRAMYLAVFHQPLRDGTVLPLPPAAPWGTLGKAGDGWRELCSRLLEPGGGGGAAVTLEAAAAEMERLGAARGGSSRKVVVGAAVGVVVLGVAGAALVMSGGGGEAGGEDAALPVIDASYSLERWQYVCGASWDWFADFASDVKEPAMRAVLARDAHLDSLVKSIEAAERAGMKLNPRNFEGLGEFRLSSRSATEEAPEEAKSAAVVRATAEAERVIRGVEEGLKAEKWPALGALAGASAAFGGRGWEGAKAAVDEIVAGATPGPQKVLSVGVEKAIAAAAVVGSIEARWGKIEAAAPDLEATGDAVLARFSEWARAHAMGGGAGGGGEAGGEALAALDKRLGEVEAVGTKLREFVRAGGEWETIDSEEFRSKSEVHRDVASREPGARLFEDWLFQVTQYRALARGDDPRASWEGAPLELIQAGAVSESIGQYLASKSREPEAEDVERSRELDALRRRLEELRKLRWSVSNRAEIEREAPRLVREAAELKVKLDRRLTDMRTDDIQGFAEAQARLREREAVTSSAVLNEAWRAQRDAIIAEVSAAPGGGDTAALRRRASALEDAIVALDAAVPKAELPTEIGGGGAWVGALSAAAAQGREEVIGGALRGLAPGSPLESAGAAAAERYRAAREGLIALASDASALEGLLREGYGLNEAPAAGGESVGVVLSRMESALGAAPQGLRAALSPLVDRAGQLRAIGESADQGRLVELVSAARAETPEQALAAWRRLGELSWPGSVAELDRERALRETLSRVVGALPSAERRSQLEGEMTAQALARFERGAAAASSVEQVEAALGMLGGFGLTAGELRAPALKFNLMLLELRRGLAREGLEEAAAQELVRGFVSRAKSEAGEALAASAGARAVVEGLEGALAAAGKPQERPRIDLSTLGPGALGAPWQTEVIDDGAEVIYRRDVARAGAGSGRGGATLELRFIRVATGEGTGVYLLASELSLEQFIGIVEGARKWSEMSELLRAEDARRTLTVWEADDRGLKGATFWTSFDPLISALRPMYAAGLRPADLPGGPSETGDPRYNQVSQDQGPPSVRMPMQQVPVWAAMYAARLAGCRLPTDAEWRAALESEGGVGELSSWNLRDATWAEQHAHIRAVREEMVRVAKQGSQRFLWPDQGSFALAAGRTDIATDEQATAWESDDGRLWFAPVLEGPGGGAGRRLRHLVGNVAEYVFDDPAALEGLGVADPYVFEEFADRNAAKVGIIGGSSISPPNVAVDAVARPDPLKWFGGFADVGIRLAFTADGAMGPERFATVALRTAAPEGYVLGR